MNEHFEPIWSIGLMSGTSMDGIDAALIKTDGMEIQEFGEHLTLPYPPAQYAVLNDAIHGKGDILKLEHDLTYAHAEAVEALLKQAGMSHKEVKIIGFHGQTMAHRPEEGITWQIGDGALLAALTRIDVVNDLRRRDVAAGGQGAPVVPLYHVALSKMMNLPVNVLNIGGISNLTWVGKSEDEEQDILSYDVLAFDTGPGNALLNDWVRHHTGQSYDKNGRHARAGKAHQNIIDHYLALPYFDTTPPKSLDRMDFSLDPVRALSLEDGAATLTELTAQTIVKASDHMPVSPNKWIVTGGGRHNPAIMDALSSKLEHVCSAEDVDWSGDALEAQAFAFLAVRSLRGLAITLPTTTGASHAVTGGAFHRAGYYGVT